MRDIIFITLEAIIACGICSLFEYIELKFHLNDSKFEKFGYYRKDKENENG